MSQFDKLLADLNGIAAEQVDMTKALPADDGKDDGKIQAAAEDGGGLEGNGAGDGDDDEDDKGGEPMGKSLGTVTLADGTQAEAVDGTELVKSLMAQVEDIKVGAEATETKMAKALDGAIGLIKTQGEMIKSLTETVKKVSGEGRGRKTVLSVVEKPAAGEDLSKSQSQGMTGEEFFAKANAAFDARKISGVELTAIDVALRNKTPVDPSVIAKVVSVSQ